MRSVVCTASRGGPQSGQEGQSAGWGEGPGQEKGAGPGPSFGHLSSGDKGQGVPFYPAILWPITVQVGAPGSLARQPDFGPGLGRTRYAGYNQTQLGANLHFITGYLDRLGQVV